MTIKSMKDLQALDMEKVAQAIEADAGHDIPDLREALAQAKAGTFAAVHTPDQLTARKRGRPTGTTKADAKVHTTLRLDPDILEAIKAQGAGWQTRINDLLRADVQAGRHVKV
ncbi:MAG: BrnA antitoxin family protein [Acidovorax sp.]